MSPERLEELIAEFIDRRENGELLDADGFAAQNPDAGPALLISLRKLRETEDLFPTSAGDLPTKIGPFVVIGEIGRGGMGRVLHVEHEDGPGLSLALKLLTAASWLSPRSVERLRREGQVLQRLKHPGIVRVTEVGVIEGTPFVAMELLEGPTLAQLIHAARSGSRDSASRVPLADRLQLPGEGSGPLRAARIVAKLARAVAAAHREGLLHRDIKPGNVILTGANPILIDFGLAGGETGPTLTRTGDVLGTPNYMSPEQARGDEVDVRTDVYSLGAVLYELLTLRSPHAGEDSVTVLESVRTRPIAHLRRVDPEVPRELETIVMRAMAYSRKHRYADAEAVSSDLEAFLDRRRIRASRPGLGERAANAWRFRRRELTVAAMVPLLGTILALALWKSSADREMRVQDALDRAAMAWAAGDTEELEAVAVEMQELSPSELTGDFLLALAQNRDLEELEADEALEALEAGARALRSNRATDAVQHLRRAASLAPGSPLPVVMLGTAAQRAEMLDLAEEELAAAVRLLPASPDLHKQLARVYMARERFEDAEASLEAAVALAPEDPLLWHELGQVRYSVDFSLPEDERDFTDGLEASTRAVELSGDDAPDAILLGHARLLDMVKRFADAQVIYRKLLEKNPDSAGAHYRLAYSLDSAHQELAAMQEYQKVLELRPNNPTALMSLAFFFSGARRWDGCEDCIEFYDQNPEYQDFEKANDYALRSLRYGRGQLPSRLDVLIQVARRTSAQEPFAQLLEDLRDEAYGDGDEDRGARLSKALWDLRQR